MSRKILCLHGGEQTKEQFKYQLTDIISELQDIFTFDFLDSPNINNTWWNSIDKKTPTQDENHAAQFLSIINNKIESDGPYYGLLGYSQGAAACIVYLAYKQTNNIERIYMFNGYVPTIHHGLMKNIVKNSPFSKKSLIFIGKKDYHFYDLGLQIKSNNEIRKDWPNYKGFTDYVEIISDNTGHNPPTKSDSNFNNVINFFKNKPQENNDNNNLSLIIGLTLGLGLPITFIIIYLIVKRKIF